MQNVPGWGGGGQMKPDHGLHLDDAGGQLDQPQAQGVELGGSPRGALGHQAAQGPQQPVGSGMEKQAELVGGGRVAGGTVGGQVGLPGLDVVLGLSATAVDVLIERAAATGEVGDDETGVGAVGSGLDTGDDALDPAPAGGPVEEFLEPAQLAARRGGIEAGLGAGLQGQDVGTERGGC